MWYLGGVIVIMRHDTAGGVVYNVPPGVIVLLLLFWDFILLSLEWYTPEVWHTTYIHRVIYTVVHGRRC